MSPPTRKRPHEAGVDLGGDRDRREKYSETHRGASAWLRHVDTVLVLRHDADAGDPRHG